MMLDNKKDLKEISMTSEDLSLHMSEEIKKLYNNIKLSGIEKK